MTLSYAMIEYGSKAYRQALELRHQVLRVPLGMDLYDGSYDDLSTEDRFYHFGAFKDDVLVGCVMGIPISPTDIRIKQMAIAESFQKQGVGKRLFMAFEAYLLNLGISRFVLHAREVAHGFYLNMGYAIIGDSFEEVGIPHYHMEKSF